LVKTGDVFTKDVTLKSAADKIYYKVRRGAGEHFEAGYPYIYLPATLFKIWWLGYSQVNIGTPLLASLMPFVGIVCGTALMTRFCLLATIGLPPTFAKWENEAFPRSKCQGSSITFFGTTGLRKSRHNPTPLIIFLFKDLYPFLLTTLLVIISYTYTYTIARSN
jgi:hypothetical protein